MADNVPPRPALPRRPGRVRQWALLRLTLLAADALALGLAFGLAFGLRFNLDLPILRTEVVGHPDFYRQATVAIIPLWLALFALVGLYRESNLLGGTREYALVFNAVSAGVIVVVLITFFSQEFVLARAWLLISWAFAIFLVDLARFSLRRLVYRLRGRGWFLDATVILGTNEEAISLAEQLGQWRTSGLDIIGLVSPHPGAAGHDLRGLPVLGHLDELVDLTERHAISEVIVATSAVRRWQLVDVFRQIGPHPSIRLRLSGGLYEVMTTGLTVKELAYVPLIEVQPARLTGADRSLKALLDYSLALVVVILFSPLFLALALAVNLSSPGPILHRRRVLGLHGREFDAYKFRTMRIDGDRILAENPALGAQLAQDHKLKDDPRVTRIGHLLRKTSLDELPQIFNVLRGQMSIVGPRMISPAEHAKYGRWDMNLLTVKPGITGLWQVSGRSDLRYEERVRLDMNYIRNWTIWEDLRILVQTVPVVLGGKGAY